MTAGAGSNQFDDNYGASTGRGAHKGPYMILENIYLDRIRTTFDPTYDDGGIINKQQTYNTLQIWRVNNLYIVKKYDRTLITVCENKVMRFSDYDQYSYGSIYYENIIFDTSGSSGFDYTASDGIKYLSGGMLTTSADLTNYTYATDVP